MLRSLIGLSQIFCGNSYYSEQNEEACCRCCDASENVCGARPERIHEQAASGVGEGLSCTVAQKPDGEYASQEGFWHPLLKDGVGRDVVYAGSGPLYRQGTEGEDEGGSQASTHQREGPDEDTQEVQEDQVDPVPQHDHHGGAEHHASPPEAHQQPVTHIPGCESVPGEEALFFLALPAGKGQGYPGEEDG